MCGNELTYHGSTSAMNEHLKLKHPLDSELPESKSKRIKLATFTKKCSKGRTDRINTLIVRMIARDIRPLNVVNGEGFNALISYLEPGY